MTTLLDAKMDLKMPISFADLKIGATYSRSKLAEMWGYSGLQALARGVVTPRDDKLIILFVTQEKQTSAEQYADELRGDRLYWEGPNDHFAESRIVESSDSDDQIHLFYRDRHHSDFTYMGQIELLSCETFDDRPSTFVFQCQE